LIYYYFLSDPCFYGDDKPQLQPPPLPKKGKKLSSSAIIGIVVAGIVVTGLLGAYVYCKCLRDPTTKLRKSPAPSDESETSSGGD
jgi:hypothetical protein